MKKKAALILALGVTALSLTACQGGTDKKETNAETTVTEKSSIKTEETTGTSQGTEGTAGSTTGEKGTVEEAGGWKFTFEDIIADKAMENVSTQLGYSDVSTSEFHKEASEGMKFCLVKLKIEKGDSTEEVDFSKMKLKDENGKEYSRMDDAFISDLQMKRMPGTKLNFGANDGWVCFEVEEAAQQLSLEYPFANETLSIQIM